MRTTVELPSDLLRAAKARAAERGEALKALFVRAVSRELGRSASGARDEQIAWRALSARDDRSHKLWTDDYLAGFAQAGHLTLVTLERGFVRRYPSVHVEALQHALPNESR